MTYDHHFNASSVHLPEIVIPSADHKGLSPEFYSVSVLLPESFRGGCSFGLEIKYNVSRYKLYCIKICSLNQEVLVLTAFFVISLLAIPIFPNPPVIYLLLLLERSFRSPLMSLLQYAPQDIQLTRLYLRQFCLSDLEQRPSYF